MIILKNESKHQQLFGSAQQLRNLVHTSSTSATIASIAFQSSLLRILPVLSETPSVSITPRGEKLTGCSADACWRKRWAESLLIIHGRDLCVASRNDSILFKHVLIKLCIWLFCNKCNLFFCLHTAISVCCLDRQCAHAVVIKTIHFQGPQEWFCF